MRQGVLSVGIPEDQLKSWTSQGAIQGSSETYAAVQQAITAWSALRGRKIDIYLQGSYKNSTNIRAESDVDVVVHCHESFFHDVARLAEADQTAVKAGFVAPPDYDWPEFRGDVYDALVSYFGAQSVRDGNKCIKVWEQSARRVAADVVPAFDYRVYTSQHGWIDGIAFLTQREGRVVIGFPDQHYQNGVHKQQATKDTFKPTVRMFKNATERAIDLGLLGEGVAPSYFVECAVWNVPDSQFFVSTWQEVFSGLLDYWASPSANWPAFMCVNNVLRLIDSGPDSWSAAEARGWLAALRALWVRS